jgi:16S rRNA (cytosine1402-N4)-methyltransferase
VEPKFAHKPVLLKKVIQHLQPRAAGKYADGTVGGGGHAEAILAESSPNGWLFGCDRDGAAVEAAARRLEKKFAGRFELRRGNFAQLDSWIEAGSLDGVLLDLGMSSPQIDTAERGFSFQESGPLDMRMDRSQALTAASIVNEWPAEELARVFWEYGDERESRRFARAIAEQRESRRFETTRELAELIERLSPRRGRKAHPATRVFQALRIAVNDEIGSLKAGVRAAVKLLRPGGRLAVITFHSLEDRIVKEFGRERARDYEFSGEVDVPELRKPKAPELEIVTRKPALPDEAEIAENPRSRSAQLRVFQKK